jgi:hypothetical protein
MFLVLATKNFIDVLEERITFEMFLPILQTICKNRSSDTAEDSHEHTVKLVSGQEPEEVIRL